MSSDRDRVMLWLQAWILRTHLMFWQKKHMCQWTKQNERGLTDEQLLDLLRAKRNNTSISRDVGRRTDTGVAHVPASESVQSVALDQRPDSSLDMSADLCSGEPQEEICADHGSSNLADVPSTSNGPDYHALEELRASSADATNSHRANQQKSDASHMPAGDSVQSDVQRQSTLRPSSSVVSASKTASVKAAYGSVPPTIIRQCTLRIPGYGCRSTQYVDLSREPVDLSQDAPSEVSHDEPSQELSDESPESSDEEPPREILNASSESSLAEPSPTDSGFFDFENVPGIGPKPVNTNAEDRVQETTPKDSSASTTAALPSDDEVEEEAGSSTNDTCAHKNCRRPQSELINWVQCDNCEEWYHSLCILGTEKAVDEDEFHCGCAKNGKRTPMLAQHSKNQ
ncbi:Lysine-specific demethylase 5A [Aphelenchoides avenae]|nr:Lysine-specific demethylase 5A [Aphelenchus avenae]